MRRLALQGTKDPEVNLAFALEQIAGRQTARRKLPSWAEVDGIVYPPHLSMEQCSSEPTARYKATIVGHGARIVDLTGGFGVDFSFMAQGFAEAVYVERQPHLCDIARHNFQLLGLQQGTVVCGDGADYLRQQSPVDVIYLDPARRDDHGGRTYAISDCTPDVVALRDLLLERADRVLLKLSPMLDWRKAVSDIGQQYVREVHIVSVGNECKELLLLLHHGEGFKLVCVNDESAFEVNEGNGGNEANGANGANGSYEPYEPHTPHTPHHGTFLYEPNASIMKAGCFDEVAQRYGVSQVAQNSHLFVADERIKDFPGRTFLIDTITSMNKRELKAALDGISQANIAVRNFPLSVAELRKRLKLSEGGSTYIFATTLASDDRVLLVCRKPID